MKLWHLYLICILVILAGIGFGVAVYMIPAIPAYLIILAIFVTGLGFMGLYYALPEEWRD